MRSERLFAIGTGRCEISDGPLDDSMPKLYTVGLDVLSRPAGERTSVGRP